MIKLKDVSKFYYQDGVIATGFTKVNLELHIGEFVVITGESGSGKSSLLNVISGLDTYEEGEMYINGLETSHYTEEDFLYYRKKYVTNIFQNFNLVNSYTVYQNIELALLLNGFNKHEVKKKVLDLIDLVNLKSFKNSKVSKLSGGQKQRVAIARALAYDTPIIVADEPTGSLDSEQSKSILELLYKISKDKLVIVVTHNKKEIEGYATRLIRMHDGKLLENKTIKEINKDSDIIEKGIKNLTLISKIRLGLRNTFNIPIKFILLFVVFLFITFSFTLEYASLESSKYDISLSGFNSFFMNNKKERIIINKSDRSSISQNDFDNIRKLDNIDYVVENDLLNDLNVGVYDIGSSYYYGLIKSVKQISSVDEGRLPTNKNEIVISYNKNNTYYSPKEILKNNYKMENTNNATIFDDNITIVGIKYNDIFSSNYEFYITDELINDIKITLNESFTKTTLNVNDYIIESTSMNQVNKLVPNASVNDGEAIVSNDLNSYCKFNWCVNKPLNISIKNIYYSDSLDLKITKQYNKANFKSTTNLNDFERYNGNIFISLNDYNKLYNKNNYQSSVFVKNAKMIEKTDKDLKNLGFNVLNMKDALSNSTEGVAQLFHIFKLILTTIMLVGLFFISYFVIKIILKSRSSYYATIRTLGGTKRVSINLLMFELMFNAATSYILFILFVYLINNNIIVLDKLKDLFSFVKTGDYILIFGLLVLMSVVISLRYGRKLFKDSVMKIYGEKN